MIKLLPDENYNIDILNQNFEELSAPPMSGVKHGNVQGTANTSVGLASFKLPEQGNFYAVMGQVRSQNNTGACVSFQMRGGLFDTDMHPQVTSGEAQNFAGFIIAPAGATISIQCWCTKSGVLSWSYAYAQMS